MPGDIAAVRLLRLSHLTISSPAVGNEYFYNLDAQSTWKISPVTRPDQDGGSRVIRWAIEISATLLEARWPDYIAALRAAQGELLNQVVLWLRGDVYGQAGGEARLDFLREGVIVHNPPRPMACRLTHTIEFSGQEFARPTLRIAGWMPPADLDQIITSFTLKGQTP